MICAPTLFNFGSSQPGSPSQCGMAKYSGWDIGGITLDGYTYPTGTYACANKRSASIGISLTGGSFTNPSPVLGDLSELPAIVQYLNTLNFDAAGIQWGDSRQNTWPLSAWADGSAGPDSSRPINASEYNSDFTNYYDNTGTWLKINGYLLKAYAVRSQVIVRPGQAFCEMTGDIALEFAFAQGNYVANCGQVNTTDGNIIIPGVVPIGNQFGAMPPIPGPNIPPGNSFVNGAFGYEARATGVIANDGSISDSDFLALLCTSWSDVFGSGFGGNTIPPITNPCPFDGPSTAP